MKDLGSFGGPTTIARALNDSGQVVGGSDLAGGLGTHAFIWSEATGMVDIGTAGGASSVAFDINSNGGVTGQSSLANGKLVAFYWSSSTGFVTLTLPASNVIGYAINDSNQMTGERYTSLFTDEALIWDLTSGITRPLGNLPGAIWNDGRAINSLGHITGPAGLPDPSHVFLWRKKDGIQDLGSPVGVSNPLPNSINDQEEIVGFSNASPAMAFYWSRSTRFRFLQPLSFGASTGAESINNSGNIAGFSVGAGSYHAVLWTDSLSAPQDLGTLPGDYTSEAYDINNLGQIVGYSSGP